MPTAQHILGLEHPQLDTLCANTLRKKARVISGMTPSAAIWEGLLINKVHQKEAEEQLPSQLTGLHHTFPLCPGEPGGGHRLWDGSGLFAHVFS